MKKNYIEEYIQTICPKIANILCELIPEKWSKIYLYAEIHDFSGTILFYFYTNKNKTPIYSLDIPEKYGIDKSYFNKLTYQIFIYFDSLRKTFENNHQEKWTSATFILTSQGKMHLEFSYESLSTDSPLDDIDKWKYKYLGLQD